MGILFEESSQVFNIIWVIFVGLKIDSTIRTKCHFKLMDCHCLSLQNYHRAPFFSPFSCGKQTLSRFCARSRAAAFQVDDEGSTPSLLSVHSVRVVSSGGRASFPAPRRPRAFLFFLVVRYVIRISLFLFIIGSFNNKDGSKDGSKHGMQVGKSGGPSKSGECA